MNAVFLSSTLHNWAKVNIKLIYIKSKCLPFLLPYKHEYDRGPFHVLQLTYHFVYQFYSRIIVLVQSSFHTTWASLFEMELEPNSLDWNGNELEHELELEDMKRARESKLFKIQKQNGWILLIFCLLTFWIRPRCVM